MRTLSLLLTPWAHAYILVWRRTPLHIDGRVWYASYILSCTGLPKTGAINQNGHVHLVNICACYVRNDSNSITIVKETRELRDEE